MVRSPLFAAVLAPIALKLPTISDDPQDSLLRQLLGSRVASVMSRTGTTATHTPIMCENKPESELNAPHVQRWATPWQVKPGGVPGWHLAEVNEQLIQFYKDMSQQPAVSDGKGSPKQLRDSEAGLVMKGHERGGVLVPLCGRTLDLEWLRRQGHPVVGVEGIVGPCIQWDAMQARRRLTSVKGWSDDGSFGEGPDMPSTKLAARREVPSFIRARQYDGARKGYVFKLGKVGDFTTLGYHLDATEAAKHGAVLTWFSEARPNPSRDDARPPIAMMLADFFRLGANDVAERAALLNLPEGKCSFCYDRASLVAIDPSKRKDYVETCKRLLTDDARILLVVIEAEEEAVQGPPFPVTRKHIDELYPASEWTVTKLGQEGGPQHPRPIHGFQKVPMVNVAYLVCRKEGAVAASSSSSSDNWLTSVWQRPEAKICAVAVTVMAALALLGGK